MSDRRLSSGPHPPGPLPAELRLDRDAGTVYPLVRVPRRIAEAACAFKADTWTEVQGAAEGFSEPIREGTELHRYMDAARGAAGGAAPLWIASDDYRPPRFVESRSYRAAVDAGRSPGPPPWGGWLPRRGVLVGFLERRAGALRFVG
jgi:hypothetical protein